MHMSHASLSQLSDAALIEGAQLAVRRERSCTAEVVAHIAEVGARKLHLRAGYSSLRDWCIAKLGLSEDAAYKRIQAARASRRVPRLLPMLERGELSLSALCSNAPPVARSSKCSSSSPNSSRNRTCRRSSRRAIRRSHWFRNQ